MTTKDDDEVLSLIHVMNHDDVLYFTNTGRVFKAPVFELPQAGRVAKGQAIVNLLQLQPEERITAILKSALEGKQFLFMTTKMGTVKRTALTEFENIRRSGLIAQKLPPGDELQWVVATTGKDEIFVLSRKGKSIRFPETDVRDMGRAAAGVRGIHLDTGDYVVEAASISNPNASRLLVVMENGLGKMTPVGQYRLQGRGGSGVKAAQLTAKTGEIVGGAVLQEGEDGDLLCISKQGQMIRMRLSDIPSRGRATQGVIVMRLNARDKVATMSVVMEDKESEAAVMEAAEEERAGEVEEIKEEVELIEKVEKKALRAAAKAAAVIEAPVRTAVEIDRRSISVKAPQKIEGKKAAVTQPPPRLRLAGKTVAKAVKTVTQSRKPVFTKKAVGRPGQKNRPKKPQKPFQRRQQRKKLPQKRPQKESEAIRQEWQEGQLPSLPFLPLVLRSNINSLHFSRYEIRHSPADVQGREDQVRVLQCCLSDPEHGPGAIHRNLPDVSSHLYGEAAEGSQGRPRRTLPQAHGGGEEEIGYVNKLTNWLKSAQRQNVGRKCKALTT